MTEKKIPGWFVKISKEKSHLIDAFHVEKKETETKKVYYKLDFLLEIYGANGAVFERDIVFNQNALDNSIPMEEADINTRRKIIEAAFNIRNL
jgi:hypothetical protein